MAAHSIRRIGLKTFCPLLLSDEGRYRFDVGLSESLDRRHRPEVPMVLWRSGENRHLECPIAMVARLVDLGQV